MSHLDFSLSEAIKRSEIVQQVIGTILAAAIIVDCIVLPGSQ
jgi:hypothetical protein